MKILVTGANGFIAKNLIYGLRNQNCREIYTFDTDTDPRLLDKYCSDCGFVFNLAGINRPKEQSELMEGNFGFVSVLLNTLKKNNNKAPVMISSSTQAALDNPYGKSKKAGEELLFSYAGETGVKVLVYRFPNVFGKWCRPNYNSAVATFCYNIARDIPITVNDPDAVLSLVYIDDVVEELIRALNGKENITGNYCEVSEVYIITLGSIADLLYSFKASRGGLSIPEMSDAFTRKLYATYLSYLPPEAFIYPLKMNIDNRGSFTEIFRTLERGQLSVNILKPGSVKGNHWHQTKNEKFLTVSGNGIVRLRKIDAVETVTYHVSGDKLDIVDIPPGYTHNIENPGTTDLVTVMWASECYDGGKPDTYYLEV